MRSAEDGFCPLCDVTLDLHDGPDSCESAGMKADTLRWFEHALLQPRPHPPVTGRGGRRWEGDVSGLSEAELRELLDGHKQPGESERSRIARVATEIVAARVASAAAERDQAVAVADSMQHFADVAEVCERKSNEYAAENAALRARLDEVRALVDDLSALTEGPDRAGTALWPDAARDAYSLAIEEAQGVLRAVLAAARDEGSEQR